ncbi:MAG TPA: V-type ATP synthase subunit E family protein [Nitrososphaerales archaeon]|nr:V-type ATP synthase subunit E family protein [Nitrososphaerales archaeon]
MSEAARNTLQKVSDEFLAEVLAQLDEGRDKAVSLLESAKGETEAAVSKILQTGTKQAASARRQLIDSAELEARNLQLKEVERAVNEVFDEAVRRLRELSPAQKEEALLRLMREGVQVIGPKATVACTAADKKPASAALKAIGKEGARLTLDQQSIDAIGGVTLTSQDGSVRFDNTFEARLGRMRQVLRREVANTLTGDSGASGGLAVEPNRV